MAAFGIAPTGIDLQIRSHPHWDHVGGLDSVLKINQNLLLSVHEGFSKHHICDLRSRCEEVIVVGKESHRIAPGAYSSELLGSDPPEQAMIGDTDGVTAAIGGCAHPGMERIVE